LGFIWYRKRHILECECICTYGNVTAKFVSTTTAWDGSPYVSKNLSSVTGQ
jgi:hypothetical protein